MIPLSELKKWYKEHESQILNDYFHFLKMPSISTDPAYHPACESTADWLCSYMQKGGLKAERIETSGLPLIYAEDLSAGSQAPTLLIYGHYDVQPVDPIELWQSPPFEPTVRNGQIYARGAVDDKGQIFYAVLAALCWKSLGRPLTVNLKFCIEGEEESQSLGLSLALPKLKEKMKADYLLVADFDQLAPNTPAISFGARGIVSLEVTLTGSETDLHSGLCGGIAYNPNRALVELLAQLWDEEGKVRVPHFYDDVAEISDEELKHYSFLQDQKYYQRTFGIKAFGGEKGRTLQETNGFRPTLEINGMSGGYTGIGFKTVIPSKATAKISCRLVPNQDPKKIVALIVDFLKKNVVPGMDIQVETHSGASAFRSSLDSQLAKAVSKAAEEVTGVPCKNSITGGSIPIIGEMMRVCNAEVVGMGFGLSSDNIHAPNEHFDMYRFEQGFLTVGRTLGLL